MEQIASCAMYVDGDGVPFWLIEQAVRDVRQRCSAANVRAYKDWTNPGNQRLMTSLWEIGVDLVQVTPHAGLANGTDIAITVDAVDTLHSAPSDAVALVGNDGDFTSLAKFLRRMGVQVLGYAARDASTVLAQECDHFTRYDSSTRAPIAPAPSRPIENLIAETVRECADQTGWVGLDKLGYVLRATHGLQAKDTPARSWSAYFRTNPGFECHRTVNGYASVRIVASSETGTHEARLSA